MGCGLLLTTTDDEDNWLALCSISICTLPSAPINGVTLSSIPISLYSTVSRKLVDMPDELIELVEPVTIGLDSLTLMTPSSLWLTTMEGVDKTFTLESLSAISRMPLIEKLSKRIDELSPPASTVSIPYFVDDAKQVVNLRGILATLCPADKKIIHGMKDASLMPCVCSD